MDNYMKKESLQICLSFSFYFEQVFFFKDSTFSDKLAVVSTLQKAGINPLKWAHPCNHEDYLNPLWHSKGSFVKMLKYQDTSKKQMEMAQSTNAKSFRLAFEIIKTNLQAWISLERSAVALIL